MSAEKKKKKSSTSQFFVYAAFYIYSLSLTSEWAKNKMKKIKKWNLSCTNQGFMTNCVVARITASSVDLF